jgi:hypothetical protein
MKYCEVGDVARKLGVTSCATINSALTDTVVDEFIEDASGEVDDFAGRLWGIHQETEEYHDGIDSGPMAGCILLHNTPVIGILKLEYWNGSEWKSNLQEAPRGGTDDNYYSYSLYADMGKIKFHSLNLNGNKVYRVTYTWGDENTPGIVKRAAACLAALRCLQSTSGKAAVYMTQNGVSVRYAGGWQYGMQALGLQNELNMHLARLRDPMIVV